MSRSRSRLRSSALASLCFVLVTACGDETENSAENTGNLSPDSGVPSPGQGPDGGTYTPPDAGQGATLTAIDPNAPTWHQQIAPLVSEKCSGCHAEGGIAPFSLLSYASAKPFAKLMVDAVESGRMPPFLAQETDKCKPKLGWKNDIRLTDEQKQLLRAWANGGAPEGDASKAAPVKPSAPVVLEREDVIMTIPKPIVVDGKKDLHTCLIVDPKLVKDEYGIGTLITSGNNKVLHHVVSYLLTPSDVPDEASFGLFQRKQTKAELGAALKKAKGAGPGEAYDCFGGPALEGINFEMLDAWAPGGLPNLAPPDSGQPLPKDSLVLLDMHYHPTGTPETDSSTKLSLMLLPTGKPKFISRIILLGNFEGTRDETDPNPLTGVGGIGDIVQQPGEATKQFKIPANVDNHLEEMTWTWQLPLGLRVTGMGTHMHYVGRGMRITLEHATPTATEQKEECLIETPNYNFNWQRGYSFDAAYEQLPEMRNGDKLHIRCDFNNTMANPYLAKALSDQSLTSPIDVKLGEDTLDEMCLGAFGISYPNPAP